MFSVPCVCEDYVFVSRFDFIVRMCVKTMCDSSGVCFLCRVCVCEDYVGLCVLCLMVYVLCGAFKDCVQTVCFITVS